MKVTHVPKRQVPFSSPQPGKVYHGTITGRTYLCIKYGPDRHTVLVDLVDFSTCASNGDYTELYAELVINH